MPKPVPISILAQLLDMTPRNIQLLAAAGVIPKPIDRKYDLVACVVGYIRHLRKIGQGQGSASLIDERAALTKIRKERELLKLETERGNLVDKGEAEKWLFGHVNESSVAFDLLPRRVSEELAVINDPKEIEFLLRLEVRRIKNDLSAPLKKGGKCYEKKDKNP